MDGGEKGKEGKGTGGEGEGTGQEGRGGEGKNHLYLSCFTPSWLLTVSSPVSVILMGPPNTFLSAPYGKSSVTAITKNLIT